MQSLAKNTPSGRNVNTVHVTEVLASDRESTVNNKESTVNNKESTVNNKASTLYSFLAQVQKKREDLAKMKQHQILCSQE